MGPHLTPQGRLGWGLPQCQVLSWSIQLFGHNTHRSKIWGLCPFLGDRELVTDERTYGRYGHLTAFNKDRSTQQLQLQLC